MRLDADLRRKLEAERLRAEQEKRQELLRDQQAVLFVLSPSRDQDSLALIHIGLMLIRL